MSLIIISCCIPILFPHYRLSRLNKDTCKMALFWIKVLNYNIFNFTNTFLISGIVNIFCIQNHFSETLDFIPTEVYFDAITTPCALDIQKSDFNV